MDYLTFLFIAIAFQSNSIYGIRIMSPEDFMKQATSLTSTREFLEKYVRQNGTTINITVEESDDGEADRMTVGGVDVEIAKYDYCNPRNMTVKLGNRSSHQFMYFPPCTRAVRCGGCSTNDMMECVPVPGHITTRTVKIVRTRLPSPGMPFFDFDGYETETIEEHTRCEPRCKVQPSDCNAMQEHIALDCRCRCINEDFVTCPDSMYFDESTCSCRCLLHSNCLGQNTIFDENTCQCRLMTQQELMLVGGMSDDDYIDLLNGNRRTTSTLRTTMPTTPTTTTTTTTTTSSTTTTPVPDTSHPCDNVGCPPRQIPRLMSSNRCQCVPNLFPVFRPTFRFRPGRSILRRKREFIKGRRFRRHQSL